MSVGLLVVGVALVYAGVPLCGRVYFHLGLNAMFSSPILTNLQRGEYYVLSRQLTAHMEVAMAKQLPPVLVPDDGRPGLPLGNAEEDNLVAQNVFIVKVRGLGNLSSLEM